MAKSKLAVVERSAEQTVVEPEAEILDQSAPENSVMPESIEAPPPELADEEAAILSHKGEAALRDIGEEQLEPPAPFDFGVEHIPDPGNVVVTSKKIEELIAGRTTAARQAEQSAKDMPDASPAPEKIVEEQAAQKESPAKTEKANRAASSHKEDKTPKPEKTQEPPSAQKAGETRKARNAQVIDFTAGKRTSPLPEGKSIPEPAVSAPTPPEPKEAQRPNEPEQIVYLNLSELHAFKNHPFQVKDDADMKAMVESVKAGGVNQPAIVRPRAEGGYEIISGHRRQKASELAGYANMPCIVRNLSDDEAVLKMAEDNINQRKEMLPSERAKMLKMQLEAIKHQGARDTSGHVDPKEVGMRSNEIVADRNSMTVKQVQRYIRLDELVPDLMKKVDEKQIAFTPAVEMSYIRPKNQRYIAVAIEGQQSAPSLSQAQRMRELDQKGMLNGDVIDGIMLEEKKEVDKVIISSQELSQYFGKDKTPRDMKDQILKLLDEWKGKQPELSKPEKRQEQEK